MKKRKILSAALIALAAFMLPSITKAQTERVWSFGPEVGLTISKYGNDGSNSEAKPGMAGGLFLTHSIINTFGITAKLLYNERGAEFSSQNTKQTLQYIEIPVMGRLFLNQEGNVGMVLQLDLHGINHLLDCRVGEVPGHRPDADFFARRNRSRLGRCG